MLPEALVWPTKLGRMRALRGVEQELGAVIVEVE
jgi:hypothetical protein